MKQSDKTPFFGKEDGVFIWDGYEKDRAIKNIRTEEG
jgi:hypothetical protein